MAFRKNAIYAKRLELSFSPAAGEKGRENRSFPEAEALKPLGFRERERVHLVERAREGLGEASKYHQLATARENATIVKMTPEKKTKREISAGLIVFRRTKDGPKFLILYHGHRYWNFPKGKIESEEKALKAALRETHEEAGLGEQDLRILDGFRVYQEYFFRHAGQQIFKIVIFYLAETRNPRIRISREHQGYAWFLYPDAMKILERYRDNQNILKKAYDRIRRASARRREENSPR